MADSPNGNQAVFSEVLEVSVSLNKFAEGLKALESAWTSFCDRVGKKVADSTGSAMADKSRQTAKQMEDQYYRIQQAKTQEAKAFQAAELAKSQTASAENVLRTKLEQNAGASKIAAAQQVVTAAQKFEALRTQITEQFSRVRIAIESNENAQLIRNFRANISQLEAEARKAAAGINIALKNQAQVDQSGVAGFFGGLASNLPSTLAFAAKLQIGMMATKAAMDALLAPARAFSETLSLGWKHIDEVQQSATKLVGVIADNARFSADFAKNFQAARQAATYLVEEFEKFSSRSGVPLENLQRAFSVFASGGGLGTVGTMKDAAQVVEMLTLGLSNVTGNAQQTRRILAELPKFLQGSLQPSSALLRLLHMSSEEARELVNQAKQHGNLLQLLEPRLKPYLTLVEQADLRMASLNAQIEHMKERIAESLARPIWDYWLNILQRTAAFLRDHENSFKGILSLVGQLTVNILKLAASVAGLFGTGALGRFFDLAVWTPIVVTISSLNVAITSAAFRFKELALGAQLFWTVVNSKGKDTDLIGDLGEKLAKASSDYKKAMREIRDAREEALGHKKGELEPSIATAPYQPTFGAPEGSTAKDRLRSLKESLKAEVDEVKNQQAEVRNIYENAGKTGEISRQHASEMIVTSFQREKQAVQDIGKQYEALARQIKGLSSEDLKGILAHIKDITGNEAKTANNGARDTAAQYQREALQDQLRGYQQLKSAALEQQKYMVEVARAEADAGYRTRQSAVEKEKRLLDSEHEYQIHLLELESRQELDTWQRSDLERRKAIEDQRYTDQVAANAAKRIAVSDEEFRHKQQHSLELEQLDRELALEEQRHSAAMSGDPFAKANSDKAALAAKIEATKAAANLALAEAQAAINAGKQGQVLDGFILKAKELGVEWQKLVDEQEEKKGGTKQRVTQWLFGPEVDSDVEDSGNKFTTSVIKASKAFEKIAGVVSAINQQLEQGNVAGAIGAGMMAVGSAVGGPWGAALSAAGGVVSTIGSLFTAAARRIASEIRDELSGIMDKYRAGDSTLFQTMQSLEQERASAIARLSGKKGGQKELDQILQNIDQSLAQLRGQQKQILETFNDSLHALRLHSDELSKVYQSWVDINKQVKDYIGAGGDAKLAAEYMSRSLQKLRDDAQKSLSEGEQSAIQEAIQLNDLLKQRVDLEKQYAQQEFELRTRDAVERRQAGAVTTGRELATMRQQHKEQLDALNNQIALSQSRVDMERQVFKLSNDTATLQAESNKLNLRALAEQIAGWKDLQTVIANVVQGKNGLYTLLSGFWNRMMPAAGSQNPGGYGPAVIVNGGITISSPAPILNGLEVARQLQDELQRRRRYGIAYGGY